MPSTPLEAGTLELGSGDRSVVLAVDGILDQGAGETLIQTAAQATSQGATRVEIDLSGLSGFTDEGAGALVACRQLCAGLAGGLHYRTVQGPGRDALLVAYAES